VSGSGISWAICKSAPRSRQITKPAPHHSVFLQAGCPFCLPTNSVKALKASGTYKYISVWIFLSVCQLSVNENQGTVKVYTDWNANEYLRYAHLPVKPNNDYYCISDIMVNSEAINGDVINVMAVVKRVSAA